MLSYEGFCDDPSTGDQLKNINGKNCPKFVTSFLDEAYLSFSTITWIFPQSPKPAVSNLVAIRHMWRQAL